MKDQPEAAAVSNRVITTNAGRGGYISKNGNRTRNYGLAGRLDATHHVEVLSHRSSDGYTLMDFYNYPASWSGLG